MNIEYFDYTEKLNTLTKSILFDYSDYLTTMTITDFMATLTTTDYFITLT